MEVLQETVDNIVQELSTRENGCDCKMLVRQGCLDCLVKFCTELAPFRKVVVLYTKLTFEVFGKQLTDKLNGIGIKPINFLIDDCALTIKNLSGLFCLPEDVRLSVGVGVKTWGHADYYAKVMRVKSLSVVCDNPFGRFSQSLLINNEGKHTVFSLGLEKSLFFLSDFKFPVHDLFYGFMGKMLFVSDYVISKRARGESVDKLVINIAKRILDQGLKVLEVPKSQRVEFMISRIMELGTVEFVCGINSAELGLDEVEVVLKSWKNYYRKKPYINYIEWASEYSRAFGIERVDALGGVYELVKEFTKGKAKKILYDIEGLLREMAIKIKTAKAVEQELKKDGVKNQGIKENKLLAYELYPFGVNTANIIKLL